MHCICLNVSQSYRYSQNGFENRAQKLRWSELKKQHNIFLLLLFSLIDVAHVNLTKEFTKPSNSLFHYSENIYDDYI